MSLTLTQSLLESADLSHSDQLEIQLCSINRKKDKLKQKLEEMPSVSNWAEIFTAVNTLPENNHVFFEVVCSKLSPRDFVLFINQHLHISNQFLLSLPDISSTLVQKVGITPFTRMLDTAFSNMFNYSIIDFDSAFLNLVEKSTIPFLDLTYPLRLNSHCITFYLDKYPSQIKEINQKSLDKIVETFIGTNLSEKIPDVSKIFANLELAPINGYRFTGACREQVGSLLKENNWADISKSLGITNRALKKELYSKSVENKIFNLRPLLWISSLIKYFPTIDQQLLIPLITPLTKVKQIHSNEFIAVICSLVSNLKKLDIKDEKVVNLLKNINSENSELFLDVASLLENSIYNFKKEKIPITDLSKKINKTSNSMEKLHYLLIPYGMDGKQITFNLPNSVLELKNKSVCGLDIFIPKESRDLFYASSVMHICVGNGRYAEKIDMGLTYIILLTKNKKPLFCAEIQLQTNKILEIKGVINTTPPDEITLELNKILQSLPEGRSPEQTKIISLFKNL